MSTRWAVGVDIGGTQTRIGLVSSQGALKSTIHLPTTKSIKPGRMLSTLLQNIELILGESGITPSAIGIGIAGQVDSHDGTVYFAPNLHWRDVSLGQRLEKELQIKVKVINDARAATWAEWQHGEGKGCDDLVCLFVGTGVGGGIVSNGHLLNGSSNSAGELGHLPIDQTGRPCTCGGRGCLEAWAGGWAIAKQAVDAITMNNEVGRGCLKTAGGKVADVTAKQVCQAYYAGDPLAKRIIDEAIEALVAGIVSIVHTVNPKKIILSGGVIHGMPELIDFVRDGLQGRLLSVAKKELEILPGKFKDFGGVIGAGSWAIHH